MNKVSVAVIPRRELLPGAEYVGVGDGFNTARWDSNRGAFLALKWDGSWRPIVVQYGDGGFFPITLVPVFEAPSTLSQSALTVGSQKKRDSA